MVCGGEANQALRAECELSIALGLAILNFPLSIAWWLLVGGSAYALSLIGIEIGQSRALNVVAWAGIVVLGYVQWFKILPWVIRKLRSRKQATA
jgi:hypothetical protein